MSAVRTGEIKALTGLRIVAALWVVLFHMSEGKHIEALHAAVPTVIYRVVFSMGDLGVPVFFVLIVPSLSKTLPFPNNSVNHSSLSVFTVWCLINPTCLMMSFSEEISCKKPSLIWFILKT